MSVNPTFQPTPKAPDIQDFFGVQSLSAGNSFGHTDIGQSKGSKWKLTPGMRSNLGTMYGANWYDLRAVLKFVYLGKSRDMKILDRIRWLIMELIPVRTGKLIDHIFKTLRISRTSWYSTHYLIQVQYDWPNDRPLPIPKRVQHSPPEEGYGEWGTGTRLTYTIPNVKMLRVSRTGLSAVYLLNDPTAVNNPIPLINEIAQKEVSQDIYNFFQGAILTLGI